MNKAEFIKIWQSATSLNEVAEKTGLSLATISSRASRLRKQGFELQKFKRLPSPKPFAIRHKRKIKFDRAQFAAVWYSSRSREEVAEQTGLHLSTISSIAKELRENGVPLKRFPIRRPRASRIDHEEFARVWNSSHSREEVAAKTGMSVLQIQNTVGVCRKKGIYTKKFQAVNIQPVDIGGARFFPVAFLAQLVVEIYGGNVATQRASIFKAIRGGSLSSSRGGELGLSDGIKNVYVREDHFWEWTRKRGKPINL